MTTATLSRKSKAAAPINAPTASALPWWHAPTVAARDALSLLLNAAHEMDDFEDDSRADSALRLVRLALVVVDDLMRNETVLSSAEPQACISSDCFDCIALLRATLVHPDGTFDIRRRTWVQQSLRILDVLSDLHMSGPEDGPQYVEALSNVIASLEAPPDMPAKRNVARLPLASDSEDEKERREFSLSCVSQIGELADGMKVFEDAHSDEKSPFIYGVCSRIELLATLIFHAQKLHGDPEEQWGNRTVRDLQAAFDGRFV